MDLGKAFGFVFDDEAWVSKVLIGGIVMIIPIVNFAVFGYMLKTAENVARGNPRPLPEWSEFGDLFMRGLYYFIITLVYQIPTILFACVWVAAVGGLGAMVDSQGSSDAAAGGVAALALCFYPLIIVLALVLSLASYPAVARYLASGNLSEAFKFGEVFASLRNNIGPWIILVLVSILASFVGQLGLIACGIGILFTSFYAQLVTGHAFGQTIAQLGMIGGSPYAATPIQPYEPPTSYQ